MSKSCAVYKLHFHLLVVMIFILLYRVKENCHRCVA